LYNGFPAAPRDVIAAAKNGIDVTRDGIVSRGVLLDVPRRLGRDYLSKGEAITIADLVAAEEGQRVRVEEGDILLVRTGRRPREQAEGENLLMQGAAGLHVSTMPWLKERGIAVLGSDGVSDVMPSGCEGNPLPVHAATLVAMGIHLLDNLALESVAGAGARRGRWEFQLLIAPLVIEKGTGSAVNPVAIF
jgi:kynurenine formamidase